MQQQGEESKYDNPPTSPNHLTLKLFVMIQQKDEKIQILQSENSRLRKERNYLFDKVEDLQQKLDEIHQYYRDQIEENLCQSQMEEIPLTEQQLQQLNDYRFDYYPFQMTGENMQLYQNINFPNIDPDHMTYEELLQLEDKMGSVSKGLTLEEIQKIKLIKYKKKCVNEEKCSICQNEYKISENIRILNCKHNFHMKCLDQWLEMEKSCPICKQEVTFEEKQGPQVDQQDIIRFNQSNVF